MNNLVNSLGKKRKLLLISSPGGHIAELWRLERLLERHPDSLWITSRNEQTETLLAGRRVIWTSYVAPRDVKGAVRVARLASRLIKDDSFDACVSAGAALASFALPRVALSGIRTVYIESLTRLDGPSATGMIASISPRVETWTQHSEFRKKGWQHAGSVLDGYSVHPRKSDPKRLSIFVTLGTIRPYRFDRAVNEVLQATQAFPGASITWQLGSTERSDLPGEIFTSLNVEEVRSHMSNADVVIGHAGVGTMLDALESGKRPILLPRSGDLSEHVDSHQIQLARALASTPLAECVFPNMHLTSGMLERASEYLVEAPVDK